MAQLIQQPKLDAQVEQAMNEYNNHKELSQEFSKDPNNWQLRSRIAHPQGATKNGVPITALGQPQDVVAAWAQAGLDKAREDFGNVLDKTSYSIIENMVLEKADDVTRIGYTLDIAARLTSQKIDLGLPDDIKTLLGMYMEQKGVQLAVKNNDQGRYAEYVARKGLDRKQVRSLAQVVSTQYMLTHGDEGEIQSVALAMADSTKGRLIDLYRALEKKARDEPAKQKSPYKVLKGAVDKALEDNKTKGIYLGAYDTLLDYAKDPLIDHRQKK